MSLQCLSSLPPNKIMDDRDKGETCYQKWLERLTDRAVEKALQLQTGLGRQVDIVDTKSCGEPGSKIGCSNPFSSLSLILLKNSHPPAPPAPLTSSSHHSDWSLLKDSEDRCHVTSKIYNLLVQWRSDCSFEWRAKVASALHVLEEAFYREAKSKEEYTDPSLLESQLKQVLCHFEAGNGIFLLQGVNPLYPVRTPSPSNMGFCTPESSTVVDEAAITGSTSAAWTLSNSGNVSVFRKNEANDALWEAVASGQTRLMEEGLQQHGEFASKKIVRRVISRISSRRRREENKKRRKHDMGKVSAGDVINVGVLAMAEEQCDGTEQEGHRGAKDTVAHKHEGAQSINTVQKTRKRSGKTLRDMLRLQLTEGSESRAMQEAPLSVNEKTDQDSGPETSSCMQDGLPLTTQGDIQIAEPSSYCSALSDMFTETDSNTSSSSSASEKNINEKVASAASLSPALALPQAHLNQSGNLSQFASSSCFSVEALSSSPSASTHVLPVSSGSSSQSPLLLFSQSSSSSSSSSSLSSLSLHSKDGEQAMNSDTMETPEEQICCPTITNNGEHVTGEDQHGEGHCEDTRVELQVEAAAESVIEEQADAVQVETGQIEESGNNPSPRTEGERGERVPLSSFLAQREDQSFSMVVPLTSYESGPWDTWEEPTEQLDPFCCVCMVGLKGAAFVPCGHTFCRKCSRELWKGRGMCPLCNRCIKEILDIF